MSEFDIAVIGLACRFPGAENANEFWDNLIGGIESFSIFSEEELKRAGVDPALIKNPSYVRSRGIISKEDMFDAAFFGYSPREAELIDPQQRLFLEEAWNALEQAGYNAEEYHGAIGVFAGCGANAYWQKNLQSALDFNDPAILYQTTIGNDKDFLATRVAYKLNLTGPAINVQTACSTSLVAIHLATQSLLNGECDMALAGAVSIGLPQKSGYLYQEGMILSPDGHCRAFDAQAEGTMTGNGVGVVVLKRLDEALNDRDYIYAVVKGSAINNDGSKKVGYTAPSVSGQARAIAEAQTVSDIHPDTITYIETHGTGTPLGDPIEVRALTQAFRRKTNHKGFCAIGSVKTNVGHLDTAAGAASFIKTALAVQKGWIPASLHFQEPNPQLDLDNSPFYVNNKLSKWDTDNLPRRAGVSAFGIGGTNAHIILEQISPEVSPLSPRSHQLLLISAKTVSALDAATANLSTHLQKNPDLNLADVAYTLQVGRKAFSQRRFVVAQDVADAISRLSSPDHQQAPTGQKKADEQSVAFLFPGQGSQYVNMGREIYQLEPVFRQEVDLCAQILKPLLGLDLRHLLYPNPEVADEAAKQLQQTSITQPALFVTEYALAKLWMSWGIKPSALIGHSLGEYVAACLAGVFSLDDALKLVTLRARLMQQMPSGDMLAVQLSETELLPLLGNELSLAAVNAPNLCVASGPGQAIQALQEKLTALEVGYTLLHTSHAFHSKMMEPILAEFAAHVAEIPLQAPLIPWVSTVTGEWITPEQATDPDYWVRNIRQTVRFSEAATQLLSRTKGQKTGQVLLEVGPGHTLTTLAKQQRNYQPGIVTLRSLRHPQEQLSDEEFLLTTLGQLWNVGVVIDWNKFYAHEQRYRLPLPTYPFERQRCWVDAVEQKTISPKKTAKDPEVSNWFHVPAWKRTPLPPITQNSRADCFLLFMDDTGLGNALAGKIRQAGKQVVTVHPAASFAKLGDFEYALAAGSQGDYEALANDLHQRGLLPSHVLHLWNLTASIPDPDRLAWNEIIQVSGFYSLLYLAQALEQSEINDVPASKRIEMVVFSNNMQNVLGDDLKDPEKATLLGPVRVIPREYPNLACRSVDLLLPSDDQSSERLLQQLIDEIYSTTTDVIIAYRGSYRWVQSFEPLPLPRPKPEQLPFKNQGVYLITGGLGGAGMAVAEHLARTVHARLILIGRSFIPPAEEWSNWLSAHLKEDPTSRKIRKLQELESLGGQVWAAQADVTDLTQIEKVLSEAEKRFGQIQGIFHAAGIPSDELIQFKTGQTAAQVLAPKLQGTLILEKVFHGREKPLDLFVLFSSLASVLASPGRVDYSAANAFLDAFAVWSTAHFSSHTVAIGWDTWQETGMSVGVAPQRELKKGLLSSEALDALERVLANGQNQDMAHVLVSASEFSTRYKEYFASSLLGINSSTQPVHNSKNAASELSGKNDQYVVPRSVLEKELAELWSKSLGVENVGIRDDFFALGGHSLLAVSLVAQIKKHFGRKIPLSAFLENATIERLSHLLGTSTEQQTSSLAQIKEGKGTPFFLVHPIGGSILCYNNLTQLLNTERPIYGLQSLGMQGEQVPLERISDMAEKYVDTLRSIQAEGPYWLAGWSMGGVVAFEMAQLLRQAGQEISLLIMIDSWLPREDNSLDDIAFRNDLEVNAKLLMAFFEDMWQGVVPERFSALQKNLGMQPTQQQLQMALEHAQELGLISSDVEVTQIEHIFNVFKANRQALLNYTPSIYPEKIVFIRALEATNSSVEHPAQTWGRFSLQPLKIRDTPGNHYTMFSSLAVEELAKLISQEIEKA